MVKDENAFLFVVCVTNEDFYKECVQHIEALSIPDGYNVAYFPIYDAKSMTEGYNRALKHKAKFKLYIHQDTYILNKNILHELLHLFQNNTELGLLGMVGCKKLPSSGIWWEGKEKVGKMIGYHNNRYINIQFNEASIPYTKVDSLDGFFMATQYNLPWREEIEGFHFYDASYVLEFLQQGYDVGIPYQKEPWTSHINKEKNIVFDKEEHKRCQEVFLTYYKQDEKKGWYLKI